MLRLDYFGGYGLTLLVISALLLGGCFSEKKNTAPIVEPFADWSAAGHDAQGTRYSPLAQINRENVGRLKVAWTYRTGDYSSGLLHKSRSAFETTPIMVGDTLYLNTPFSRVIALDSQTGREKWTFDSQINLNDNYGNQLVARGVSTWFDQAASDDAVCRRRIFLGTNDGRLIALDSASGKRCGDFGAGGEVVLTNDIGEWIPGEYQITSPPAVVNDLVIVGSAIADYRRTQMPLGTVRAFDARTGALRWSWNPLTAESNGQNITSGAANVWSLISADAERDLVFLPTSAPSPDYYGGQRPGNNLYANAVVALRASTGKVLWHYQFVHHDVWDYDTPAQPALITVRRNGQAIPAVVVVTKMGFVFVFNRETGAPLFPISEQPAPQKGVDGETLSPTQPVPQLPPPLVPQKFTTENVFGTSEAARDWCRERVEKLRAEGIFTPPSLAGTLYYPAYLGGMNWSGVSFDPERNLLITNTNSLAATVTLFRRANVTEETKANWKNEIETAQQMEIGEQAGSPYVMRREWLIGENFTPCNPPPWGTLAAIDLTTGAIRWQVPLGRMPELSDIPESAGWGSLNLGGSLTTAGGLIFIAAARDNYLRAFDVETGTELWKTELPAGGQAAPMTYQIEKDGRQYIVIAAGGHGKLGTPLGDYVVAYALP